MAYEEADSANIPKDKRHVQAKILKTVSIILPIPYLDKIDNYQSEGNIPKHSQS